jgi:hypothetical protein
LAKRTASAPFGHAGASPTAFLSQQHSYWERTPSPITELCHQSLDFGLLAKISFSTAEFSRWERVSSPTALVSAVGKDLGCWRSHSFLLWMSKNGLLPSFKVFEIIDNSPSDDIAFFFGKKD